MQWGTIIVDDDEICAMLDTGAERNFIRENVVARLGMLDQVEENRNETIYAGNGQPIVVVGTLILSFKFGGVEFLHRFNICPNLFADVLKGEIF